ncbi:MAG: hypothetical protein ACR2RE_22825, partial [Geminicoccaceae bacterium]
TTIDPEASAAAGSPQRYGATLLGRHHAPGEMAAPLNRHSLGRSLVQRYRLIDEVRAVEDALGAGGLSAGDLDLAATMYGRLLGENVAHETGHFAHGTFVGHVAGGLMQRGADRTMAERTGMAPGTAGGAILVDNGAGTINALSAASRRTYEDVLPVKPPLDAAEERGRGRVGSFGVRRPLPRAMSSSPEDDAQIIPLGNGASRSQGWLNRSFAYGGGQAATHGLARPLSGETVHLPGSAVLEGWQARAFITALDAAFATAVTLSGGSTTMPLAPILAALGPTDNVLSICDRLGVTIGLGPGIAGGIGIGPSGGAGIVFAPGRRIGFYGGGGGAIGWIYSGGVSAQLTIINGGPDVFGGLSYTVGVTVETIGWVDAGLVGLPVGAHIIFNPQGQPIGVTLEAGPSIGVPVISLIEGYGQRLKTVTTFGLGRAYDVAGAANGATA